MKKIPIILYVLLILQSCYKEPQIVATQSENVAKLSSNDDNDDHDENDNDEHETECCSFKYGEWTTCTDGYQIRTWTSRSTTCVPPIDSIQRTCQSAIVQYFYYNPAYNSLRVVCNLSGPIHIYNSTGQLTAIVQFESPTSTTVGRWVSVAFLPIGTYQAKFYTRTITFTR